MHELPTEEPSTRLRWNGYFLVFIIPAVMSLAAVGPLPYGYYQLLRLVVAICAVVVALQCGRRAEYAWVAVFGLMALTYNPIFRVSFGRRTWAVLNVVTACIFLVRFVVEFRRSSVEARR